MRQQGRECGFPYATFAGEDKQLVAYAREASCDEGYVGIRALRRSGTYCLIGAALTGIALAGLL